MLLPAFLFQPCSAAPFQTGSSRARRRERKGMKEGTAVKELGGLPPAVLPKNMVGETEEDMALTETS